MCDYKASLVSSARKYFGEISSNFPSSEVSDNNVLLMFHIAKICQAMKFDSSEAVKAGIRHVAPGLDSSSISSWDLTASGIDSLRQRMMCKLCFHFAVNPIQCSGWCQAVYCYGCAFFLAKLFAHANSCPIPSSITGDTMFVCPECGGNRHSYILTKNIDAELSDLLSQTLVKCRKGNCDEEVQYDKLREHETSCKQKDLKLNIRFLHKPTTSYPAPSTSRPTPSTSTVEVFHVPDYSKNTPIDDSDEENAQFDNEFDKRKMPFGPFQQDIILLNASKSTQLGFSYSEANKAFTEAMIGDASSTYNAEFLAMRIRPRKVKPTSVWGLNPPSVGTMKVNDIDCSLIKASQIIGPDRSTPPLSKDDWKKKEKEAMQIKDPIHRLKRLKYIRDRQTRKDFRNNMNVKKRIRHYETQLARFCPPFDIPNHSPNRERAIAAARQCLAAGLKIVALDIEGQTLRIDKILYGVPGSVGMVGNGRNIVLHEIIHWPRELLASDKPQHLTGLDFKAGQYGNTLAYVRERVFSILSSADRIILHGQSGDLKGLYFKQAEYDEIRHKIRDVGAYYNIRRNGGTMAVQIATYLLFQEVIQGLQLHYAIVDAFWTLALYYADMDAIEDCYENCQNDIRYDNGWPEVVYPPNKTMSWLYQQYQAWFNEWPYPIKRRKVGKPRRLHHDDDDTEFVEPADEPRPPYLLSKSVFDPFYKRSK